MIPSETFVLGAADPEMEAIEGLLREAGAHVIYALGPDGARVRPADAYRAAALSEPIPAGATVYRVECDGPAIPPDAIRIDHHRPGDPGYGRPPAEFMAASSIGQVISRLGSLGWLPADWPVGDGQYYGAGGCLRLDPGGWVVDDEAGGAPRLIPQRYVYAAAADHCLAAAYRGECPGVDPDALMRWRVESRARFQRRPVEDVLADVERAREALRNAPLIDLDDGFSCDRHYPATPGRNAAWNAEYCDPQSPCRLPVTARDMRGRHVPELPEASAREGVCFIADGLPGPDGRIKVVCQSGSPEQIAAFMRAWAPAQGLVDIYGDPARGFAGGYKEAT